MQFMYRFFDSTLESSVRENVKLILIGCIWKNSKKTRSEESRPAAKSCTFKYSSGMILQKSSLGKLGGTFLLRLTRRKNYQR